MGVCFSANPLRLHKDSSSDRHPVPWCPCILFLRGLIPTFLSCKAPVRLTAAMSEYQASYQQNAPLVYAACFPAGMELCLIQTKSLGLGCDRLLVGVRKPRLTPSSAAASLALRTLRASTLSLWILWLLKLRQSQPSPTPAQYDNVSIFKTYRHL